MRETPQSFKFGDGNTTPIEDQLIEKFSVEESVNEDASHGAAESLIEQIPPTTETHKSPG